MRRRAPDRIGEPLLFAQLRRRGAAAAVTTLSIAAGIVAADPGPATPTPFTGGSAAAGWDRVPGRGWHTTAALLPTGPRDVDAQDRAIAERAARSTRPGTVSAPPTAPPSAPPTAPVSAPPPGAAAVAPLPRGATARPAAIAPPAGPKGHRVRQGGRRTGPAETAHRPPAPDSSTPAPSGGTAVVVGYAAAQVGKRYVHGRSGPHAFDCSGLVVAAFRQIGIGLPHQSGALAGRGRPVSRSDLQPGDLVFTSSSHVGIYVGNGQMVHAATVRGGVKRSTIWTFRQARRIVG